jgi:group I intron endonuclease
MIGIYKITSPTGKVYIGQSVNITKRWVHHKGLYSNDTPKLFLSFKKYGIDNHIFDIIETCLIDELNSKERYWQEYYKSVEKGLNCVYTKTHDKSGKMSCETKSKISLANKGKIISDECRLKLSLHNLGKKQSKETIEKRVSKLRGKNITESQKIFLSESRFKNNNPFFGKNHSEDSKIKIRKKLSGSNNYLYKPIINIETGIFYDTLAEASNTINWDKRKLWPHLSIYKKNNTSFRYV